MKIDIVAVGKGMPRWIAEGFQDYAKRLPKPYQLKLIEIPVKKLLHKEGEQMLAAIPDHHHVGALDIKGQPWDTFTVANYLQRWKDQAQDISLIIGGPEGLAPACLQRANWHWSLSPLTLPHSFVRIIVVEQLYRAFSILTHHPYHR